MGPDDHFLFFSFSLFPSVCDCDPSTNKTISPSLATTRVFEVYEGTLLDVLVGFVLSVIQIPRRSESADPSGPLSDCWA